ncbi:unnamed protein product [Amoebophrya sp. A120]|nr:unnamed protein product [Amoebophrya sp. A120]|eukprot:GSA120T00004111001.1
MAALVQSVLNNSGNRGDTAELVPTEAADYTASLTQVKQMANDLLTGYQADGYMRDMQKESLLQRKMKELATSKQKRGQADYVSRTEGIKEIELIEWLQKELDDEQACLTLPCSIGLVVIFSFLVLWHFSVPHQMDISESMTNWVQENANFAIDATNTWGIKGFVDVHNLGDWYSFMRLGFVPLMLTSGYVSSEQGALKLGGMANYYNSTLGTTPAPPVIKSSDLMRFNHIATDVRINIHRSSPVWPGSDCTEYLPADIISGFSTTGNVDTSIGCYSSPDAYGVHAQFPMKDVSELAPVGSFDLDGSKETIYLQLDQTAAQLERQLKKMEEDFVIKEDTYKIEVDFVNVNRAYGAISMVTMHFIFYRGGQIRKQMTVTSQWLTDFGRMFNFDDMQFVLFVDIFWVLMNLYILFSEMMDIRRQLIYWGNTHKFLSNYLGIWNLVDWSIMISSGFVIARFVLLNEAADDLGKLVKNGGFVESARREQLYDRVETNMALVADAQLQSILYIVISMCRMFKGFSAQPRLGLVTNTIWKAASDILHFMIVFGSVFASFAVIGTLLFGNYVHEYSSVQRAIISCWRMVAGDFDYGQLKEVSWSGTAVYFTFFHLLIVLIMLNMLLAIILETYLEVKRDETAKAETLFSQAMESFGRYVRSKRRERLRLDEILDRMVGSANRRILVRRELEQRHALAFAAHQETLKDAHKSKGNSTKAAVDSTNEVFPYTFMWRMVVRGPCECYINSGNDCSLEDPDFFVPGHKTLAFIRTEGRMITPKKLKQMIPDIPQGQSERVIRSAILDTDNATDIVIPNEIATEALYTMLSDDHAEMVDKIANLETKIHTLVNGDETGSNSGAPPLPPPMQGGNKRIPVAEGEATPFSPQRQSTSIVQQGQQPRMMNQRQEMQLLSEKVNQQQELLERQSAQITELTELLVHHVIRPAVIENSRSGGNGRGVQVRPSGAGRCSDMIFCGSSSSASRRAIDDEEINIAVALATKFDKADLANIKGKQ